MLTVQTFYKSYYIDNYTTSLYIYMSFNWITDERIRICKMDQTTKNCRFAKYGYGKMYLVN